MNKTDTEAMQTWVTERMPDRQGKEKPSRGSQRAISNTQEPQKEREKKTRERVKDKRDPKNKRDKRRSYTLRSYRSVDSVFSYCLVIIPCFYYHLSYNLK